MSETMGRCRMEMTAAYGARGFKPSDSDMLIADAIDRLAEDVAAIRAKVDALSPEDVAHLVDSEKAWVALVTEQRDAAIRERDTARAEVERLKAELEQQPPAAPQPAGQGISPGLPETQSAGNAAPAAAWLTERERTVLELIAMERRTDSDLHWFNDVLPAIRSLLSRAGSPPVVEVPALGFLGDMTAREQDIVLAYRDALYKAGVAWKEVGRE